LWRCASCEAIIPADSTFCPYCGTSVPPDPASAPDPVPRRAREWPKLPVSIPSPNFVRPRDGALSAARWILGQPMDRIVAALGALLVVIGFLTAVAGGPGGYPWLGLGVAALAAAAYLRLDRWTPPRDPD
jgi:hypothetical protein